MMSITKAMAAVALGAAMAASVSFGADEAPAKPAAQAKKSGEKPFKDVIKDCVRRAGFMDLYVDTTTKAVWMSIRPEQLDSVYLLSMTRNSGDGSMFDGASMIGQSAVFFKRVGNQILLMEKNLLYRADGDAEMRRAIENNLSHSLIGQAKISSEPEDTTGAILINAADILLADIPMVGYSTEMRKMPYSFDKGASWFSIANSYPDNTDIEATLHFRTSRPPSSSTLADSRSMFHRYYYSLSRIPSSPGYVPRRADDRVGHFHTVWWSYNNMNVASPYVRYVNRWNIQKANPSAAMSKPVKPLVYWIENTVPLEYRSAVRDGIEIWNTAFRKIGIDSAIVVKQMPDSADWDPADIRYNVVRWMVQPGAGYAVGPSRANPFTGELYDADIRISSDFIRTMYSEFEEFISPSKALVAQQPEHDHAPEHLCNHAQGLMQQHAFASAVLESRGLVRDTAELRKYVYQYTMNLVAHEVGHTLGLRHNFKGSLITPFSKLHDTTWTRTNGIANSVMEYVPVNLARSQKEQGDYYQPVLGPHDHWVIEYAYGSPAAGMSEEAWLESVARKSTDSLLIYATDEDTFGNSPMGADGYSTVWDLSAEPLEHSKNRIALAKQLWRNVASYVRQDGERWPRARRIFSQGWGEFYNAVVPPTKLIGGMNTSRAHIGDPGAPEYPILPIAGDKQREGLKVLTDSILTSGVFDVPATTLALLAPERFGEYGGRMWGSTIDYSHDARVKSMYEYVLGRCFSPMVLARVTENERKAAGDAKPMSIAELFSSFEKAVWTTAGNPAHPHGRELQRVYVQQLIAIVKPAPGMSYNGDAVAMAQSQLESLVKELPKMALKQKDKVAKAHLEQLRSTVAAALDPAGK